MKKALKFYVFISILIFTSCDKSDDDHQEDNSKIWFTSSFDESMKDYNWLPNSHLSVFMLDAEADTVLQKCNEYITNNEKGEFFAKKKDTFKETNISKRIQFKAFYPYSENALNENTYKINLTDQSKPQALDILYGKSDILEIKNNTENRGVNLSFSKALVQIKFDITIGVGLSPADLKNLKAEIHGLNTVGELDLNGNIINKTQIAPISLSIGDRGATAEVVIFPGESQINRKIIFLIGGKQLTWNIQENKVFDIPKTYYLNVKLTSTNCYIWDTDEDLKTIYSVGDYYPNQEESQGIVFWIEPGSNGQHGKIFSPKFGNEIWNHKEVGAKPMYVYYFYNATDPEDGFTNTKKIIEKRPYQREKAISFCTNLGEGWYLPAIKEIETLYSQEEIISKLPPTYELIWSSTEVDSHISFLYIPSIKNQSHGFKSDKNVVIPIRKF